MSMDCTLAPRSERIEPVSLRSASVANEGVVAAAEEADAGAGFAGVAAGVGASFGEPGLANASCAATDLRLPWGEEGGFQFQPA